MVQQLRHFVGGHGGQVRKLAIGGCVALAAVALLVLVLRWLATMSFVHTFLRNYPGTYPLHRSAPVGFPVWLGWQHFLSMLFIVLIIRSGVQVHTQKRPGVLWTPRWKGGRKISLTLWFHQSLDILWVLNGAVFLVLLFTSGQWLRLVPSSWSVFPNAVSVALQYGSLHWPRQDGWVNYNSLQQLAYFTTVFIAAPLAVITGARMSGLWPRTAKRLNRFYPIELARAVHFPVMIYFVLFVIAHVTLVLATEPLRNLNHMYDSSDLSNWHGFWIFAGSLAVVAAGWLAARPVLLAPVARLFGRVSGR